MPWCEIFFGPYDNGSLSPQNKATREEDSEEKEEAKLEETEEIMWSSFSVGEGLCEELSVGDIHVFPIFTGDH